jgi:hypothetical protein
MPLMSKFVSLGLGAAAVVVALVIGMQFLPGAPGGVGTQPSPSPTASPSPSVAVERTSLPVSGEPDAPRAVVDVPPTWQREADDSSVLIRDSASPQDGGLVFFGTAANTFADPCAHVLRTPEVGPTVDDLVSALADTTYMTSTEPVQTTLGGRPATYIELTAADELPCAGNEFYLYSLVPGAIQPSVFIDGPGQIVRMWVLDVDGTRVVAVAFHFPEASPEALAEAQLIIDSVEFTTD